MSLLKLDLFTILRLNLLFNLTPKLVIISFSFFYLIAMPFITFFPIYNKLSLLPSTLIMTSLFILIIASFLWFF